MPDGAAWIDGLRNADGELDRDAVREILPYGDGFRFVDRVSHLTDGEIRATYTIPSSSELTDAHFVGCPVMPGVLIGEGAAQAASILVRYRLEAPAEKDVVALQIDSGKFQSPAVPGDELVYHARLRSMNRRAARLDVSCTVDERKIFRSSIVLGIVDRSSFREHVRGLGTS